MGASSSFITSVEIDIYLSYSNQKNEYLERMRDTLQNLNFRILDSSLMIQSRTDFSNYEISKHMEEFIEKTKFIFICISKETIKSVTQIMEMNAILDKYPNNQHNILYFMTDADYTPLTNTELKSIVKKTEWYPLYDENTLFDTTNTLINLLMKP